MKVKLQKVQKLSRISTTIKGASDKATPKIVNYHLVSLLSTLMGLSLTRCPNPIFVLLNLLRAKLSQNVQTRSNNSSAFADELLECVLPFCGLALKVRTRYFSEIFWFFFFFFWYYYSFSKDLPRKYLLVS